MSVWSCLLSQTISHHEDQIVRICTLYFILVLDDNIALVEDGATCDSSSHSDTNTCLDTLVEDDSYWQTDGEGPGAWIKVSFPRANIAGVSLLSGCDSSGKIKTLLGRIKTLDLDFEVFLSPDFKVTSA